MWGCGNFSAPAQFKYTMRAMRLTETPEGQMLAEADVPCPQPDPGELLICVCAAGVTKTELEWYPTSHTKTGEKRAGAIPCHEFSGVVADGGQEVFGMNDWFADGALAEYCVAPASSVALKPLFLSHAEAASIPIGALTAWQGLFDRAGLQAGERVLIHGGAGAVGVFAIQLAAQQGAHVIATASSANLDFTASLGAKQSIDYRASRFEDLVQNVDVVFDTVGGDTLDRSWSVLRPGGRLVTVVSTAENSTDGRVKKAFFIVEPNQEQLTEVSRRIAQGQLRTVVDAVIPLSEAPLAYRGELERQGRGKIVVALQLNKEK
jgi:NADPH:quinone reductase-like Zn-dependent oxidoreductase